MMMPQPFDAFDEAQTSSHASTSQAVLSDTPDALPPGPAGEPISVSPSIQTQTRKPTHNEAGRNEPYK